jgi:hypothetical protein
MAVLLKHSSKGTWLRGLTLPPAAALAGGCCRSAASLYLVNLCPRNFGNECALCIEHSAALALTANFEQSSRDTIH